MQVFEGLNQNKQVGSANRPFTKSKRPAISAFEDNRPKMVQQRNIVAALSGESNKRQLPIQRTKGVIQRQVFDLDEAVEIAMKAFLSGHLSAEIAFNREGFRSFWQGKDELNEDDIAKVLDFFVLDDIPNIRKQIEIAINARIDERQKKSGEARSATMEKAQVALERPSFLTWCTTARKEIDTIQALIKEHLSRSSHQHKKPKATAGGVTEELAKEIFAVMVKTIGPEVKGEPYLALLKLSAKEIATATNGAHVGIYDVGKKQWKSTETQSGEPKSPRMRNKSYHAEARLARLYKGRGTPFILNIERQTTGQQCLFCAMTYDALKMDFSTHGGTPSNLHYHIPGNLKHDFLTPAIRDQIQSLIQAARVYSEFETVTFNDKFDQGLLTGLAEIYGRVSQ